MKLIFSKNEMIEAIKAEANARYDEGHGWQVFVECYSDEELLEFVKNCRTVRGALALAKKIASIRTERCQEAQNEIF
jgi:hypothetical protein